MFSYPVRMREISSGVGGSSEAAARDGRGESPVATRAAAADATKERRVEDGADVDGESGEAAWRRVGLSAGDDLCFRMGEAVNAEVIATFEKEKTVAAAEMRMEDFMVRIVRCLPVLALAMGAK